MLLFLIFYMPFCCGMVKLPFDNFVENRFSASSKNWGGSPQNKTGFIK